jgi:hypothetical protein
MADILTQNSHMSCTTARQAFWVFLAGSQKLSFLFLPSQTETPHA